MQSVDAPRVNRPQIGFLEPDEVVRLLEAAEGTIYYAPILLAVTCGLRRGEALALRWSDVNLEDRLIIIRHSLEDTKAGLKLKSPKSGKSRVITIPEGTAALLRQHRENQERTRKLAGMKYINNDLVCCKNNGTPIRPDCMSSNWRGLIEKAKIRKVTFHGLRHTNASFMGFGGSSMKVMSERLGHSTISITQDLYTHVLRPDQDRAARAIDDVIWGKKVNEESEERTDHDASP
jgi:integrase